MSPTLADGKILYIELPAADVARSAEFYRRVFGWNIRQRRDGATAFEDRVSQVGGAWIPGRSPASTPGILVYIWCTNIAATLDAVVAQGGEIVQSVGADTIENTARFRDPAGNVIGLYQQPV